MLRFDVGEDLLHYYCNVGRVTVYATAPVNVAVGARVLRQIGAGARDGGQEPRAGSIELAEASYRAAIGGTVAVPCTRHAVDRSAAVPEHERRRRRLGRPSRPYALPVDPTGSKRRAEKRERIPPFSEAYPLRAG